MEVAKVKGRVIQCDKTGIGTEGALEVVLYRCGETGRNWTGVCVCVCVCVIHPRSLITR